MATKNSDNSYTVKFNVANSGLSDWTLAKVHEIKTQAGTFTKLDKLPLLKARETMVYEVTIPESEITLDSNNQAQVRVTFRRNLGENEVSEQLVSFDVPPAGAPSITQSLYNMFAY
jgi:hypothetical protein